MAIGITAEGGRIVVWESGEPVRDLSTAQAVKLARALDARGQPGASDQPARPARRGPSW